MRGPQVTFNGEFQYLIPLKIVSYFRIPRKLIRSSSELHRSYFSRVLISWAFWRVYAFKITCELSNDPKAYHGAFRTVWKSFGSFKYKNVTRFNVMTQLKIIRTYIFRNYRDDVNGPGILRSWTWRTHQKCIKVSCGSISDVCMSLYTVITDLMYVWWR